MKTTIKLDSKVLDGLVRDECIAFLEWAVSNYSDDFEGFTIVTYIGDTENHIWDGTGTGTKITLSELYELFSQSKEKVK